MPTQKQIDVRNHEYCTDTLRLKGGLEESFLELAKRLMSIRDEQKYAPQWDSFPSFLDEAKLSESTASKLITIYRKFVLEFQIPERRLLDAGGWTAVAEFAPMVNNRTDAETWLDRSSVLSRTDLRREITEAKRGVDQASCNHQFDLLSINVCSECGLRERVNVIDAETAS